MIDGEDLAKWGVLEVGASKLPADERDGLAPVHAGRMIKYTLISGELSAERG
jgi:hypothetical protein